MSKVTVTWQSQLSLSEAGVGFVGVEPCRGVRETRRFGDGEGPSKLLLWGTIERTEEGDGRDGRRHLESLLGAGDPALVAAQSQ